MVASVEIGVLHVGKTLGFLVHVAIIAGNCSEVARIVVMIELLVSKGPQSLATDGTKVVIGLLFDDKAHRTGDFRGSVTTDKVLHRLSGLKDGC